MGLTALDIAVLITVGGAAILGLMRGFVTEVLSVDGYALTVNYGLNRVRFPAPVPVGSRVRARFRVAAVEDVPGGVQLTVESTIERQGQDKPVCVAEAVYRFLA